MHWLFCEIDMVNNRICVYDSMKSSLSDNYVDNLVRLFTKMTQLLRTHNNVDMDDIEMEGQIDQTMSQQMNGYDCGVFMLKGIHWKAMECPFSFEQSDINYFRKMITLELLNGKLS